MITLYHHSCGKVNDEDLVLASPFALNKLLYLTGGLAASLVFPGQCCNEIMRTNPVTISLVTVVLADCLMHIHDRST